MDGHLFQLDGTWLAHGPQRVDLATAHTITLRTSGAAWRLPWLHVRTPDGDLSMRLATADDGPLPPDDLAALARAVAKSPAVGAPQVAVYLRLSGPLGPLHGSAGE